MFPPQQQPIQEPNEKKDDESKIMYKYKNILTQPSFEETTTNSMNKIDEMLESEKKSMNSEPWNKLDKRLKIQKLHAYAEKYGKENSLPVKELTTLAYGAQLAIFRHSTDLHPAKRLTQVQGHFVAIHKVMACGSLRRTLA